MKNLASVNIKKSEKWISTPDYDSFTRFWSGLAHTELCLQNHRKIIMRLPDWHTRAIRIQLCVLCRESVRGWVSECACVHVNIANIAAFHFSMIHISCVQYPIFLRQWQKYFRCYFCFCYHCTVQCSYWFWLPIWTLKSLNCICKTELHPSLNLCAIQVN